MPPSAMVPPDKGATTVSAMASMQPALSVELDAGPTQPYEGWLENLPRRELCDQAAKAKVPQSAIDRFLFDEMTKSEFIACIRCAL